MSSDNVVITGIGAITPVGEGKDAFWGGLAAKSSGMRPITLFDSTPYPFQQAGEITNFNPKIYLGKKGLRYLNRTTKLLMSAAYLSLQDAGIKNENRDYLRYAPDKLGVALGTTWGIFHSVCSFDTESLIEGPQFVSPMAFANTVVNAPAGFLSIKEDIQGFNVTVSTGYNASLDAFGLACSYLENNRADCILAGGAEEFCEEMYLAFEKNGIDFSNERFPSEGSVMFSLERKQDALKRNAHIYGEIIGYGSTFVPNSAGLERAIKLALQDADIEADRIDHIIVGSNLNQAEKNIEQEAIENLFSSEIPNTDIGPYVGDCYSAGGSMQIGAGLALIDKGLANTVLNISLDPSGNNSAIIISRSSKD